MSRPFNFFEFYESGDGDFIAPIATLFVGSGLYFPPDLQAGGNVGFIYSLFEDYSYLPPNLNVGFTGQPSDGNNHVSSISLALSGNVYPLVQDSGSYSVGMTGSYSGTPYDTPSFITDFSGMASSANTHVASINTDFSGQLPVTLNERPSYKMGFTGQQISAIKDIPSFSCDFSGNLVKNNGDKSNIDIFLTYVSYSIGASQVSGSISDNGNIDINLISVFYKPG